MKRIKTLKMNYEFKNVLTKGRYFVGKQVIIYCLNNNYGYNRIGIAISSSLTNAVKRNHIKRIIRAAYQKFSFIDNNYDIVFIWNKKEKIEKAEYKVICEDLEKTFLKMKIIK